jgi:GT2 family glycosyltransferase
MKVTIGIVLYRGEKYLERCLSSLIAQNFSDTTESKESKENNKNPHEFEILLYDNSPLQEASKYIKKNLPEIFSSPLLKIFSQKQSKFEKQSKNLLHSGGHNFLISQMDKKSKAYICASYDMLYEANCIENLINESEKNPKYSAFTGKLKYWDFDNNQKTKIIDSCGLGITKHQYFFDRGQGEIDEPKEINPFQKQEVFGSSGALFFIKKSALEKIKFKNPQKKNRKNYEYFDELLHYKNDIDLFYRLFWAGEKTLFIPQTLAYHHRQVAKKTLLQKFFSGNKKTQKSSFIGQITVVYKNFFLGEFFPRKNTTSDFSLFSLYFWAHLSLFKYIFLSLLAHPSLWRELVFLKKNTKELKEKIAHTKKLQKISGKNYIDLQKYF